MVPSGQPTPIGGPQLVNPSLLRSNSGMLGGQGGSVPSQGGPFPSLISSRTQFNNINLLGNVPNVSSLLNQSFGNGGSNPGMSNSVSENDPLWGIANGVGFNSTSSFMGNNPGSSGQMVQGQGQQFLGSSGNPQILADQAHPPQLEPQRQQLQTVPGGVGGIVPVKMEPQMNNDQHGSMRGLGGQVKLETQQLQAMRGVGPVKMEQHSDQSLFLQHQQQQQRQQQQEQQQQQLLQQMSMSRQSFQLNILQQQRLLQLQQQQQQQQQQLVKALPQQRGQLQHQFPPQSLPIRSPVKPVYEPGMCARRLTHYIYQQQHRPEDNNIEFWRKFVSDFFAPNAKKKWCVSMYGSGRQTNGVFPQDVWHCEICKRKPGRGFEATVEVLPRLFKIKYESGTLEELLYVDMPREYQNSIGQIVLDYAKAIQESVFEQLRVVRDGQLRIVFSPDLKICSWEFCAIRHEELIPRKLLIPQVSQLGTAAHKYQAATQNSSSNVSVSDLRSNCNMFVASARQLAKALEVPLVNDLGYTKRYVRCLQISEVVNSMKDLIDYSRLTGAGPMESLTKFPRRTSTPSGPQDQNQQPEEQQQQQQQQTQQPMIQSSNNNDQSPAPSGSMQIGSSNGAHGVSNSMNVSSGPTSQSTIAGLLQHNNSFNSRHQNQNPMSNANSPYSVQMPSPGSSNSMQQTPQPNNPSIPFQSPPTPSTSHNPQPQVSSHGEGDTNDSQSSSMQKIIQEMMMFSQLNDVKNANVNGVLPMGNGPTSGTSSIGGGPFGGLGQGPIMGNGMMQAAMGNHNPGGMNGRVGIPSSMVRDQSRSLQQQDLGNQMLGGGAANGFNSHQFDWKPSP